METRQSSSLCERGNVRFRSIQSVLSHSEPMTTFGGMNVPKLFRKCFMGVLGVTRSTWCRHVAPKLFRKCVRRGRSGRLCRWATRERRNRPARAHVGVGPADQLESFTRSSWCRRHVALARLCTVQHKIEIRIRMHGMQTYARCRCGLWVPEGRGLGPDSRTLFGCTFGRTHDARSIASPRSFCRDVMIMCFHVCLQNAPDCWPNGHACDRNLICNAPHSPGRLRAATRASAVGGGSCEAQ